MEQEKIEKLLIFKSQVASRFVPLTCDALPALFVQFNVDGCIAKDDYDQRECIHQYHAHKRVKHLLEFIFEEMIRHTLLVVCYVWMCFNVEN